MLWVAFGEACLLAEGDDRERRGGEKEAGRVTCAGSGTGPEPRSLRKSLPCPQVVPGSPQGWRPISKGGWHSLGNPPLWSRLCPLSLWASAFPPQPVFSPRLWSALGTVQVVFRADRASSGVRGTVGPFPLLLRDLECVFSAEGLSSMCIIKKLYHLVQPRCDEVEPDTSWYKGSPGQWTLVLKCGWGGYERGLSTPGWVTHCCTFSWSLGIRKPPFLLSFMSLPPTWLWPLKPSWGYLGQLAFGRSFLGPQDVGPSVSSGEAGGTQKGSGISIPLPMLALSCPGQRQLTSSASSTNHKDWVSTGAQWAKGLVWASISHHEGPG